MLQLEDGVKFSLPLMQRCLFFPANKNSCRHWERVEGGGTGPRASTVFFLPPPGQKRNFHHWLIYGPLGFPPEIRESFWILLTPSIKINAVFVLFYISKALFRTQTWVI